MDPSNQKIAEIIITSGIMYKDNTNGLIMGKLAMEKEDKKIGDRLTLNGKEFNCRNL